MHGCGVSAVTQLSVQLACAQRGDTCASTPLPPAPTPCPAHAANAGSSSLPQVAPAARFLDVEPAATSRDSPHLLCEAGHNTDATLRENAELQAQLQKLTSELQAERALCLEQAAMVSYLFSHSCPACQ
ncbi:hypothetical protein EON66_04405 [archaeon]|nr:MAG: hypothetical protein EON66_04405 [archaeon]